MHGNVLEWCADWSHQSYDGAPLDGSAWTYGGDSSSRIGRGGMYLWDADSARSAARNHDDVRGTFSGLGFRLALDVPDGLLDPKIERVTNAASGAPGEIVTIWGINVGPQRPASLVLDRHGVVATELSGTRVLVDGIPAPLLYVYADQISIVVPYEVGSLTSTQIMVERQGQTSVPVSLPVVNSTPALFTADGSGQGQGAIMNQDGSRNTVSNPAKKGTVVSIFGTGEGQTNPPGVDGKLADSPLPIPVLPVQLLIGESLAEIQYFGGAPGEVAGLLQLTVRIPAAVTPGREPVVLRVGEASSQAGVFIAAE